MTREMILRHGGRAALVLALVALPTCNCPGDDVPPWDEDGGVDAGPEPPDATAPVDTGTDGASRGDAGSGEWLVMPGVPERCAALMARDPSALQPPLEFEPCPDRDDCRQLVMDWSADEFGRAAILGFDQAGWHDGSRGYFVVRRPDPDPSASGGYWTILAADDGEIIALWSHRFWRDSSPHCYLGRVVVGEGRYVVTVINEHRDERWVLGGEIREPVVTARAVARLSLDVNIIRAGRDHIAVETSAYHAYRLRWDGTMSRIDDASGDAVDADGPSPVGTATVFAHVGVPNAIMASVEGSVPEPLVPSPAEGAEPSMNGNTDGGTLAWLTGFDRVGSSPLFFDRVELWASPYAERMEDLSPVRLGVMGNTGIHNAIWAGHVHAAVIDDDPTVVRFFRVADGFETALRAPPGLRWSGEIPYIGPREVLLGAGTQPTHQSVIQLVDYTALEPAL